MKGIDRNKSCPAKAYALKSFYIKLLSIIIISFLGIIVYSNSFKSSFQFDDDIYIVNNYVIKNLHNLFLDWTFYPCRFVTFLSIALNYHFNGLNVFGYHLFNLAVHLASAILVWWLTLLTLSTPAMKDDKIIRHAGLIALFAGLVFVSHPLQTEAVTYIWQRAASMAALFYLTSLCFYAKSRLLQDTGINMSNATVGSLNKEKASAFLATKESLNKGTLLMQRVYYICSLITAILAMFTKENAVTLPLMILLYEYSFLRTKKCFNWGYLAPFLLTIFIIPLTILLTKAPQFQEIQKFVGEHGGTSPLNYLLTQFRVVFTYIRLTFLPLNQNLDYDYHISKSIFELPTLISFLFLAGILYVAKHLFSKYRLLSFSILWFFLTLSLESSLFPLKNVIFEHRLYLPLAGYSMFLVSGVYYLSQKSTTKTMVLILTMIITFNSILTYQRNKVWKSELTLWDDAVRKSPHKARPYNNRGLAYFYRGNSTQAMSDYNKAIALDSNYSKAYINRGFLYYDQGNLIQAMSDYNKAIDIDPENAEVLNNRGIVYYNQGDVTQAISDYNRAIAINPSYAEAYYNRGIVYYNQGKYVQAIFDLTQAIKIKPNHAEAYYNRGLLFADQGKYAHAIFDFTQAIKINPDNADIYINRGLIFTKQSNFTQAISDYTKTLEINSNNAQAYNCRGICYLRQGNVAKAMADYNKAIVINPNYADVYYNRAVIYYQLKEYDRAWVDVHKVGSLGIKINPEFLEDLKKVSGKDR